MIKFILMMVLLINSFSINCAQAIAETDSKIESLLGKLVTYTQIQLFLSEFAQAKKQNRDITINDCFNIEPDKTVMLFNFIFYIENYEVAMSEIEDEIDKSVAAKKPIFTGSEPNEFDYYNLSEKNWILNHEKILQLLKADPIKYNEQSEAVKSLNYLVRVHTQCLNIANYKYIADLQASNK
jgi:hypothetical protein